jgi:hypothetical protein
MVNAALKDTAMAAIRTKNTYLRALYERQRSRIGHGKAIGAVKHSMLVAVWHVLTNGQLYDDLGADYCRRRNPPAPPSTSSPNSKRSDTPSPCKRQPHKAHTRFPSVIDRETRTHRRGRCKRSYGHCRRRTDISEAETPPGCGGTFTLFA